MTFSLMKEQEPPMIADGLYAATLVKVSEYANAFGPRVKFEFQLGGGEHISKSTAAALSEKGQFVQVVQALIGRDLTASEIDEGINTGTLIGCDCRLLVVQTKNRAGIWFSNIEKVLSKI